MRRTVLRCVAILMLAATALSGQNSRPQLAIQAGTITSQTCASKPDQSYSLYLPSHYAPDKRWPIIYAFDPDARGSVPIELMKDAAERYGYIVAGSNNSRNGSWKVETESAQAIFQDTHARLAIDDRRIYFAGFSGGARVAAALAQRCKCAAGVLLNGAGFAGAGPARDSMFAVFAAVGIYDFNYPELSDLDEKLEQAGFPHYLRHFDGPHQWAPADVMDQALAWFQLIAMKQDHMARDAGFITQQESSAAAHARALEQAGQPYEAWREYRQAVATFDGLADTATLRQSAEALANHKAVREGAKREQQQFQEQNELTATIYAGVAALRNSPSGDSNPPAPAEQPSGGQQPRSVLHSSSPSSTTTPADIFQQTEQQIVDLRKRSESEKHPEKLVVYRRAVAGVFILTGEAGDESLAAKKFALAEQYFQLATDANPDSSGALRALATARALDDNRKGALQALRQAKEKSQDLSGFSAWLNEEPAFAKLREDPQFRALIANP